MKLIQQRHCKLCGPFTVTLFSFGQIRLDNKHYECAHLCVVSGNRLVEQCGRDPTELCKPCEPTTYTDHPLDFICKKCTQCIGTIQHIFWASQDPWKSVEIVKNVLQKIYIILTHFICRNREKKPYVSKASLSMPLPTDPQVQVKACTASADTVCGCKSGFVCGNSECTHCVQECTKGQEPTKECKNLMK